MISSSIILIQRQRKAATCQQYNTNPKTKSVAACNQYSSCPGAKNVATCEQYSTNLGKKAASHAYTKACYRLAPQKNLHPVDSTIKLILKKEVATI